VHPGPGCRTAIEHPEGTRGDHGAADAYRVRQLVAENQRRLARGSGRRRGRRGLGGRGTPDHHLRRTVDRARRPGPYFASRLCADHDGLAAQPGATLAVAGVSTAFPTNLANMRMSAKAEYAVRAMVQLATVEDGVLVKTDDLAKAQGIPPQFLVDILSDLRTD